MLGHVVGDLESDRRTEPASCEFTFERLKQIFVAILFDLEVCVARDAEGVVLHDLHAREQMSEIGGDQIFHRQEDRGAMSFAVGVRTRRHQSIDTNESIDVVGHLDSREVFAALAGVTHRDSEVEAQSADVGEGVCGIDGEGRQHREHVVVEVLDHPGLLGLGQIRPADDVDVVVRQRGTHRVEKHSGVPVGEGLGAPGDAEQLFARGESVG